MLAFLNSLLTLTRFSTITIEQLAVKGPTLLEHVGNKSAQVVGDQPVGFLDAHAARLAIDNSAVKDGAVPLSSGTGPIPW